MAHGAHVTPVTPVTPVPNGEHVTHAGHAGHGDHIAMFRHRFWWCLALSLPIVATSPMVMDWFGYTLSFPGRFLVGPVLGTVVFAWGGRPFLEGGWQEARARRPGMMLLIGTAITVAYVDGRPMPACSSSLMSDASV